MKTVLASYPMLHYRQLADAVIGYHLHQLIDVVIQAASDHVTRY